MSPQPFAQAHLPDPPARVLEVGCGRGELAWAITGQGHRVTAIDPEAPEGGLFQAIALEEFSDPWPFDAVVCSRVLHHIDDLESALAKIHQLLRPGGVLIVDEHAWGRLDERRPRGSYSYCTATPSTPMRRAHWRRASRSGRETPPACTATRR